ncbi:preprotein translocase subunit SecA [Candidatus Roizmanbacteria bacterium RIFOXYB2_FULL_38_10]|uniref:Protein translocase subunit SecA n=1 Tax=Candidatus Roizmanbacteria bacterium RIFOXYD1_FULL_38_12 TaxID=1802093 RepID=A0A1F7KZZ8_9BACT|nr:MAG: preprotein translocase subunit SecA [Candidatus Roizmanbacteria bacterium RIFOXYA2_FULL_38_14]OGK63454.1 MAG: preprotein translocase subunit SecA [Candidatus Roizmanbacteria bacterium RIFOXYA1_FULL_37_12]OGK65300.1 MAG: preprotein translocase subunit SecA [Candidatus Roizmanbacteria bacterium RIFOXYB1_FULL_40_23]OGK67986.1 MAG: preprotein translocase subunit SecA [Candidatus Roizmanbacteria bacterium RIFOXYB2_FULL_38_10]OGK69705.1 MAG: preprotein translocase subunit SecA [Candidatus Roi
MFTFVKKLFDFNQKEISRLQKKVDTINALEDEVRKLQDADFVSETNKLKEMIQSGKKTQSEILPWTYALVREAARRVLGERHYDVQLLAGIALHEGKIVEQKTGEGKTLSATTALYLNALTGKGAHLVTVNDYLARRDAGWMGKVFHFLGLKTAAMIAEQSFIYDNEFEDKEVHDWRLVHLKSVSRNEAYLADIVYGINSEFGFDYLRDNMASSPHDLVQRGFHFAVIDEADSVLIDEARTPHIISAPYEEDTSKYYKYAGIVKQLDPQKDYKIDEKSRTANLTEEGVKHIETILGMENIYEKDFDTLFHIEASLKAEALFKNNKEYIVKDGQIVIVDEFTGRLLEGRRFSEGIHQAIEAKEGVKIQRESKTLATVSLQNYFRMYEKIAGMTGTAATEAEEFHKIYKADVLTAPTHRPMVRKDHPDMIFKTEKGKWDAVVEEIATNYKTGRPVLVGTTSIEKNEHLSHLLKVKGIPHELLNAKNHEHEASIIASAGKKGSVTVATNMAGRGVDIILGGMPPNQTNDADVEYKNKKIKWQNEHDEVVALGGLYVIGTERHESRRIDNQLRGRAGRQGDPGETCFFVALEDDLMRIFGGEQISRLMTFFNFPEDQPLSHPMVSKAIEQAQVKVEGFNFDIRKHLVDFDDVLNKQRDIIYARRRKILYSSEEKKQEFKGEVLGMLNEEVQRIVAQFTFEDVELNTDMLVKIGNELNFVLPFDHGKLLSFAKNKDTVGMSKWVENELQFAYDEREKKLGVVIWSEVVKSIYLSTIDKYWTDHLTGIEDLREGINLRGYAQLDPLVEYKNEAFSMFEKLIDDIDFEVARRIFKVEVEAIPSISQQHEQSLTYKSAASIDPFLKQKEQSVQPQQSPPQEENGFKVIPPGSTQQKPGRNEPCWCGSGKKYKKCHLNREP